MILNIIGPDDPALNILKETLEKQPELNMKLNVIPWANYRDVLMETLSSKSVPSQAVFIPGHIWLPELAEDKYIAKLDSLIKNSPIDVLNSYAPDDIISSIASECKYKGAQYQLPFFSDGHILFYRKDLIKLESDDGVPLISTFMIANLAKNAHNPPHVYGLALKADASEIFTDFLPYLWEAGGKLYNKDGKPDIDNDTNIKALEQYCDLSRFCPPETHKYGNEQIATCLKNGEVALLANWGGQTAPILLDENNKWHDKYGTAAFPTPWNTTWGIAIPKNQSIKIQQKTLTTLMKLLGAKQDKQITKIAGSPVRKSSYTQEELNKYPWLLAQKKMLKLAKPLPSNPKLGLFLATLYEMVYKAFTKQLTPTDALRQAQQKAIS